MRYLLSRFLTQFVAIYDSGSLRAASDVLNVTQPALSKSLKQFESLLEVVLFERKEGRLIATPFADVLRSKANIILKEAEITARQLEDMKGNFYKPLVAYAGPIWLSEILPRILAEMHINFPKLKIGVKLESWDTAWPKIRDGEADMYFGWIPETNSLPEGLTAIPILQLKSVLYARASHPIHKLNTSEKFAQIAGFPWASFGLWDEVQHQSSLAKIIPAGIPFPGCTYGIESSSGLARVGRDTDHIILAVDIVQDTFREFDLISVQGMEIEHSIDSGAVCRSSLLHFNPVSQLIDTLKSFYREPPVSA